MSRLIKVCYVMPIILVQEPGASVRSMAPVDCGVHAWMMGLTCMRRFQIILYGTGEIPRTSP